MFGIYSYGIYVYHALTLFGVNLLFERSAALRALAPQTAFSLKVAMFSALTAGIVWASYRWFEKPMMRLRERWDFSSDRPAWKRPAFASMPVSADGSLSTVTQS